MCRWCVCCALTAATPVSPSTGYRADTNLLLLSWGFITWPDRDRLLTRKLWTCLLYTSCGKFRFNDLELGTIGGLPRLMDVGQCNDAYGAVKIALALAEAFGCGVNDLPLSLVLSWYEQKAVCILLTLLHLGIRNIRLGPTLPAFISPNVLNYLVEHFGIAPITTPEADLKVLLKR